MSIYKKSKGPGDPGPKATVIKRKNKDGQEYESPIEYTRDQFNKGAIPDNEQYAIGHFKRNPNISRLTSATTIDDAGAKWPGMVVEDFVSDNKSMMTDPLGRTALYDGAGQMPATSAPIFGTPKKSIKYKK